MKKRKQELNILKKAEIKSLWFWILSMCIAAGCLLLLAYVGIILKNNYANTPSLERINDVVLTTFIGIVIGLGLVIFSFIFLNVFKKLHIKDFFEYYCYLNSLKNKSKLILIKDKRIIEFYSVKKQYLTRTQFIDVLAEIFNYSKTSLEYKNLINEVVEDFAKHMFLDPNFKMQKRSGLIKAVVFEFVIPLLVNIIIIVFLIVYNWKLQQGSLKALSRFLIICINIIFTLSISLFVYELYLIKHVKNVKSFNDYYFLSFNNYSFKYLNSSWVQSY
ncbi:hypothetical protein [[Mycoplasma] anseris]|uniref:Uncharacterized protein n=1 Tax=[Mycoplasma] anseris TaxID=92400 RepID=A0A2Z4NCK3_9BACT|nr:hypothetical protein [[Mycoplasma] anseris]AWX69291.1 hypothetical protein DP065_00775 [[Mycoplasma] anseris]